MSSWLNASEITGAVRAGQHAARRQQNLSVPRIGRVGDRLSSHLGAGMDYADSRPLAAGDDPRHINWRATARNAAFSSTPLVRVYHPEVSGQTVLVLDGRANLWFASEGRLKWAQALRAALYLAAERAEYGDELGILLILQTGQQWMPLMPARTAIGKLAALAAEEARVPDAETPTSSVWQLLQSPDRHVQRDSQMILISDPVGLYSALNKAADVVRKLSARFDVQAIEITDSLDYRLPKAGRLSLTAADAVSYWRSQSESERVRYESQRERVLQQGRQQLTAWGLRVNPLATTQTDLAEALAL